MKWLKRILILLLVLVILAGATAAYLIANFDPNDYKDRIHAVVKEQTGRDMVIEGEIGLSLFPRLGITLGETRLSNAQGFSEEAFARIGEVELSVALMPLLRRELQVDRVRLEGLTLNLERDADGRTNWDDLAGEPDEAPDADPEDRGPGLQGLDIGGVVIRDARVSWRDAQTGTALRLDPLNMDLGHVRPGEETPLTLSLTLHQEDPAMSVALDLKGRVTLDPRAGRYQVQRLVAAVDLSGETFPADFSVSLETDLDLNLSQGTANMDRLSMEVLGAEFTGSARARGLDGESPVVEGGLRSNTFSLRTLLEGIGQTPPATTDPDALTNTSLEVDFEADADAATLSRLLLRLDDTRMEGDARVTGYENPAIRAELDVDAIDLDRYLPPPDDTPAPSPDSGGASAEGFEWPMETLRALDLDVRLAIGELVVRGMKLSGVTLKAGVREGVLELEPVQATMSGSDVKANLRLDVRRDQPRMTGGLRTGVINVREIVDQLNELPLETADPEVLKQVSLDVAFDGNADTVNIRRLDIRIDDTRVRGTARVGDFRRPTIRAEVDVDTIDLDRYLAPPAEAPAAESSDRKGWSDEPLDLPVDLLRDLDIEARLAVGKLVVSRLQLADLVLPLTARDGLVEMRPFQGRLYQGAIRASLSLDVRGESPRIGFEPGLQDVHMGPLLDDLTEGEGRLAGTTRLAASLVMQGNSVREMISTLGGDGEFNLSDGAVKGINIAQIIRDAEARLRGRTPEKSDEPDQTDFSEMSGSLRIVDGVVSNEDLRAASPLLRVQGQGSADLAREQIDYRVDATLVATLEGQGGRSLEELRGVNLPIRVRGPFDDLSFSLDLKPVLEQRVREEVDRRLEESVQPRIEEQRERLEDRLRDLLPRSR